MFLLLSFLQNVRFHDYPQSPNQKLSLSTPLLNYVPNIQEKVPDLLIQLRAAFSLLHLSEHVTPLLLIFLEIWKTH